MERVCFLARVRPDRLEEYRAAHRRVWPEMTEALSSAGWANYTIFLADDGLLVGYLETDDYEAALQRMAQTDVNGRWPARTVGAGPGCGLAPTLALAPTWPWTTMPQEVQWSASASSPGSGRTGWRSTGRPTAGSGPR